MEKVKTCIACKYPIGREAYMDECRNAMAASAVSLIVLRESGRLSPQDEEMVDELVRNLTYLVF